MGTVALHACKRIVRISLSERAVEYFDFRHCGHNLIVHLVVEVSGHILRGAVRELDGRGNPF
ncbi:unknown [Bacteroides sp. CAG:1060]|nr:unknown [Bacteroides sp. CAG:1060]